MDGDKARCEEIESIRGCGILLTDEELVSSEVLNQIKETWMVREKKMSIEVQQKNIQSHK